MLLTLRIYLTVIMHLKHIKSMVLNWQISVVLATCGRRNSTVEHSVVSIVSRLGTGRFGVRISAWVRNSSPVHMNRPRRLWGLPGLLFNVYWFLLLGWSGRGVMLATHLHPALRLRMSSAVPLLLLYAFMAWTGTYHVCIASYIIMNYSWHLEYG